MKKDKTKEAATALSRRQFLKGSAAVAATAAVSPLAGCYRLGPKWDISQQDASLTIFHTSDMHSKVLPFMFEPNRFDQDDGLLEGNGPYGGVATVATLLKRERAKTRRAFYMDSGDVFQGAPIFNYFKGEVELRSLVKLKCDVMTAGNHEFDMGGDNFAQQVANWVTYPVLACNYLFEHPDMEPGANNLARIIQPYTLLHKDGLTLGVIGVGDYHSLTGIYYAGNSLGITVLDPYESVAKYIGMIKDRCDLIVVLSHQGVEGDQLMAKQVPGIDLMLGGHLHVTIDPPQRIYNSTSGKEVLIAHSNVNCKFLHRLDLVVKDKRIADCRTQLFPMDNTVADDPEMVHFLQPYVEEMAEVLDEKRVIGRATGTVPRIAGDGGDSPLGNLVAESMQRRRFVETNFAMTNSLGIRADLPAGDITVEKMFEIFPFENTIVTLFLSGNEVKELFDYIAQRSASRGGATQAHIAGAKFKLIVKTPSTDSYAKDIMIGGLPLNLNATYELATNDYIADGGSGFQVLERNTTKANTMIPLRNVAINYIEQFTPINPNDYLYNNIEVIRE